MADTVRLRHMILTGDSMLYFYEGEAKVVAGVVELPSHRREWIQRAMIKGYRKDIDGNFIENLDEYIAQELARDVEAPVQETPATSESETPDPDETTEDEGEDKQEELGWHGGAPSKKRSGGRASK